MTLNYPYFKKFFVSLWFIFWLHLSPADNNLQIVWTQIILDVLLYLIWIQNVCWYFWKIVLKNFTIKRHLKLPSMFHINNGCTCPYQNTHSSDKLCNYTCYDVNWKWNKHVRKQEERKYKLIMIQFYYVCVITPKCMQYAAHLFLLFWITSSNVEMFSFSAIGLVWANRNALPNYVIPVVPDYAECYFSSISDMIFGARQYQHFDYD